MSIKVVPSYRLVGILNSLNRAHADLCRLKEAGIPSLAFYAVESARDSFIETFVDDTLVEALTPQMIDPSAIVPECIVAEPWVANVSDSATFVEAIVNPPEPNGALKEAVKAYHDQVTEHAALPVMQLSSASVLRVPGEPKESLDDDLPF